MEEKKVVKPILELIHRQDIFKINISSLVEQKIRFLCKNIWDVEWSGVLFYKIEGNFEDKSLVIKCIDLFQMDIGTSAYTEFNVSPSIATYMVDHPELLEEGVYQGLIHSHNNMATFFSGTDTATLSSEGNDMSHFVSLIVNNAGKYTAGITRKYKCVQTISEKYTYPTWNGEIKEGIETFDIEEEKLEWFNLEIEIENSNSFETEMLERIKEIKDSKAKVSYPNYNKNYSQYSNYGKNTSLNVEKNNNLSTYTDFKKEEKALEDDIKGKGTYSYDNRDFHQNELPFEEEELLIPYGTISIDKSIVQSVIRQLITSSIIITNESSVDITKWANSMESLYRKRFGTVKDFEYFASNYLEYLINYTYDTEILKLVDGDETIMSAILAYDVLKELEKLPKNPWLNTYIKLLDDYII